MSVDRRKLLEGRIKAKALLNHPDLPAHVKALAKRALDHADVALGLDDALARRAPRTPQEMEAPTAPGETLARTLRVNYGLQAHRHPQMVAHLEKVFRKAADLEVLREIKAYRERFRPPS